MHAPKPLPDHALLPTHSAAQVPSPFARLPDGTLLVSRQALATLPREELRTQLHQLQAAGGITAAEPQQLQEILGRYLEGKSGPVGSSLVGVGWGRSAHGCKGSRTACSAQVC